MQTNTQVLQICILTAVELLHLGSNTLIPPFLAKVEMNLKEMVIFSDFSFCYPTVQLQVKKIFTWAAWKE